MLTFDEHLQYYTMDTLAKRPAMMAWFSFTFMHENTRLNYKNSLYFNHLKLKVFQLLHPMVRVSAVCSIFCLLKITLAATRKK